jgi:hypothetical protein
MALTFPAAAQRRLAAAGGGAAVSLLEVATIAGARYYWSDADIIAPTALAQQITIGSGPTRSTELTYYAEAFQPWLLSAGPFKTYRNTTTSTGQVEIQNISGDTVRRDVSRIFSQQAMVGALVYYRTWLADCQFATFSFMGRVDDADIDLDGDDSKASMTLQLESLCCWAKIDAPNQDICSSCQLAFGSIQCGSTSPTPCNNDYGSCTSIERFMGVVLEWNGAVLNPTQYVTPEPLRLANPRVAG